MNDYDILKKDFELNKLIDEVDNINKDNMYASHGRIHILFVVEKVKYILESLGYDEHIIELGMISALLHDIGAYYGKSGHVNRSVLMCKEYLDKTKLSEEDKNTIICAIADHSKGENICSPIGASLILADKLSTYKDRVLPLGYSLDNYFLLDIVDVELNILDKSFIINYKVTDNFSKDNYILDWGKGIKLIKECCKYFRYSCLFKINDKIVEL